MKSHRLLEGKTLDLRSLTRGQRAFLKDLRKMARQGASYFEIYRTALGPGSPALGGGNCIDRNVVNSPMYVAARDVVTRAGIERGRIRAPSEHK